MNVKKKEGEGTDYVAWKKITTGHNWANDGTPTCPKTHQIQIRQTQKLTIRKVYAVSSIRKHGFAQKKSRWMVQV